MLYILLILLSSLKLPDGSTRFLFIFKWGRGGGVSCQKQILRATIFFSMMVSTSLLAFLNLNFECCRPRVGNLSLNGQSLSQLQNVSCPSLGPSAGRWAVFPLKELNQWGFQLGVGVTFSLHQVSSVTLTSEGPCGWLSHSPNHKAVWANLYQFQS